MREGLEKSRSASPAASLSSLVVLPAAREAFTSGELVSAYEEFLVGDPLYRDEASGLKAAAYRFGGERVLIVYEESETGSIFLIHPTFQ